MYNFNYHCPSSLQEAESLYAKSEDPMFLAGGHTLLPTMKQRLNAPTDLIDLAGLTELAGISREGDVLQIGAYTRHADVADSELVQAAIPALAKLARGIGDTQVRYRGTIGGSVANNDPAADYPAALLGLGATVVTTKRSVPADEFFVDMFESGEDAAAIVERKGLTQISDAGAILELVESVISDNASKVAEFRDGKDKLFGFFVGQAMKASGGKANPQLINDILKNKLK